MLKSVEGSSGARIQIVTGLNWNLRKWSFPLVVEGSPANASTVLTSSVAPIIMKLPGAYLITIELS